MSLPHAILGLLRDQPMTGYDLKTRCFDRSIRHFWNADQAQIYRTLTKLADDGLLRVHTEPGEGKPDRRVYHLTAEGKRELRRWLRDERAEPPAVREPFLVQLFFADELSPDETRALLEDQRAKLQARLDAYRSIDLPALKTKGLDRATLHQRMTLEMGLRMTKAHLGWIEACLEALGKE